VGASVASVLSFPPHECTTSCFRYTIFYVYVYVCPRKYNNATSRASHSTARGRNSVLRVGPHQRVRRPGRAEAAYTIVNRIVGNVHFGISACRPYHFPPPAQRAQRPMPRATLAARALPLAPSVR
jgi:hypothetical protein